MFKWYRILSVSVACMWCFASRAGAWETCGDAACEGAETCVSCAEDCGECDPPIVEAVTIDSTSGDNPPGTESCQVTLHINEPGVRLLAVSDADISTDDPDGFFQHPLNGAPMAPLCAFLPLFPDLTQDSYITFGVECEGVSPSGTSTGPFFDIGLFQTGGQVVGEWYNVNPPNGLGLPDENGNVLIAQFTYGQTHNTCGELIAYVQGDFGLPEPECPDLDGNGEVGPMDLSLAMGGWGLPCEGCPNDFNGNGEIDMGDIVIVLASWGSCDQEILPIVEFPVSFQCQGPPCFIDIEAITKWKQDPDLGAGVPSSVDMQMLEEQTPGDPGPGPNAAVADNFMSNGRPTSHVRWWGSYIDPAFGPGAERHEDAYLISFFAGHEGVDQPDIPLGTYGCSSSVVLVEETEIEDADGLPVYEYTVPLELCCVLEAELDPRDASADLSPAQNEAFIDVANFLYWIDIQAVVGQTYVRANDSCEVFDTANPATEPFWAWHSSDFNCPEHSAQGNLVMGPAGELGYANWEQVSPEGNVEQAYELLTLIETCEEDFTGSEGIPDGKVGSEDLGNLLGTWGEYSPCNEGGYKPGDFNTDARVDAADLAQLLGKWGACRCYENSNCPSEQCVPAPPQSPHEYECVPIE